MDAEARAHAERLWRRMDEARLYPTGSWAQRWLPTWTPWGCTHDVIRCIHGDEIIARNFRRRLCMVCGRALAGGLPRICWFTGAPHASVAADG